MNKSTMEFRSMGASFEQPLESSGVINLRVTREAMGLHQDLATNFEVSKDTTDAD